MANKEANLLLKIKSAGEEILDRLVITWGDLVGAIEKIPEFVGRAIDAFREQEQAVNQLNQSMINQGVYSAELQNKYLELAGSLQKVTLFSDDQINSAQALLQSHIGSREVTESLLKATLNLAAAKKMDLASAADLVGKAITSENDILSRHGIHLDETVSKTDKMGAVIDAINHKFNGQAEAAAKGTGSTKLLGKAFGELLETIGERLAPAINIASTALATLFFKMAEWGSSNKLAAKSVADIDKSIEGLEKKLVTLQERMSQPMGAAAMERTDAEIVRTQAKISELTALREKAHADELASEQGHSEALAEQRKENQVKLAEEAIANLEAQNLTQELAFQMTTADEERRFNLIAEFLQKRADKETDAVKKRELLEQQAGLRKLAQEAAIQKQSEILEQKTQQAKVNIIASAANLIAAAAADGSKEAFLAQKAAAFAGAYVAMNLAAAQALAVPPAPNVALAGYARAAGLMNIGAIAATTVKGLAEGGVVPATPGGQLFRIGEGGQDEAVIPLDRAKEFGMGGGGGSITIIVNGGLLGDEASAYEFAKAVDRNLLKLRQNNESVSFDSGVI